MFFAISARMMITTLLAWELTEKESALAFVNLALAIPMFIGAFVGGAIVDRLERRQLILLGLICVLTAELSVLVALIFDVLTFPHLLLASFMAGSAHPFIVPATTTVMYQLLGQKTMANGVGLMSSAMNLSRVLGPALVGILVATRSIAEAFTLVVCLNLVALFCQFQLPTSKPKLIEHKSLTADIRQGLGYLVNDRALLLCLLFGLLPIMLAMSTQYMLVIFSDQVWNKGAAGLGVLFSAMGFGGLVGAVIIAKLGNRVRQSIMVVSAGVCAIFFMLFSMSPIFVVAVLFLGIANCFASISQVSNQVVIQLLADESARGRISGFIILSFSLGPLVLFPVSFFVDRFGPVVAMASWSGVVALLVLVFYFSSSTLKSLDSRLKQIQLLKN